MARYQATLAYDGTGFFGYQRQGNQRTVQSEVENALRMLGWQERSILSAGRTDTGVHADGQVIAFDMQWRHSPEKLCSAINAHLPEDVAVRSVTITGDDFHPRYDAHYRSYRYHIYCHPQRNPLRDRFAWRVWPAVELDAVQAAAQLFVGRHDFAAFGTPPRPGGSTIRVIFAANWSVQAGDLLFEITGNAFLYHMVRRLVFSQVMVGQGKVSLAELASGVQNAQPQIPGLAPACGLVLQAVGFTGLGERHDGLKADKTAIGEDDCGKDLRH
ncbi:MAG: tRNA pseudouridine(38-40) synthase TruA [Chloroflexi bacterium]|jgi:tRNA pseudouridine38-40 synthase|nr:tRNA pseudouridine(38-40) synthase TruA [Anaerolineaceae bacterium]NMB87826.1 tRNA pseudouridine(38-40) synthase TruA [Chloroflexota bacterium]